MEEQDKIIVFKRFDSSIDANLAKTKLDAYGIPCFLTEENLTNLYPLQNIILFGVRLHIFSKDHGEAEQILSEVHQNQDEITVCPRCRSRNVFMEQTENFGRRMLSLLGSIFFVIPLPKVYRCHDCHHEFKFPLTTKHS